MKIKDIQKRCLVIIDILIYTRQLIYDSYKMLLADSDAKHELIFGNKFLMRVRRSLWQLAVIELSQVIGKEDESHHLKKLLNILLNNYKSLNFKSSLSKNDLHDLQGKIDNEGVKLRVERLLEVRNQHYAHKQGKPDNHIHDIKFYYEDAEHLLLICEEIMETVMQSLLDEDFAFKEYYGEQANDFFTEIIEDRTKLGRKKYRA